MESKTKKPAGRMPAGFEVFDAYFSSGMRIP
jgi:hypothetical protein